MRALFFTGFVMISFFVTGYMYTEKKAGERIKNAAQGLFTFATYGLGMFIGTYFSGFIADKYKTPGGHDWQSIGGCLPTLPLQ